MIKILMALFALFSVMLSAFLIIYPLGKKEQANIRNEIEAFEITKSIKRHKHRLNRFLDIVFSSTMIVLFSYVIFLAAIAIFFFDRLPIIESRKCAGENGVSVDVYRFRTDLHKRYRLGRFLQRSSIEQLPKLYNILKGDISLFGIIVLCDDYFNGVAKKYKNDYKKLYSVSKPGMISLSTVLHSENLDDILRAEKYFVANDSVSLRLRMLVAITASPFFNRPSV